jgi:hypothetical protein
MPEPCPDCDFIGPLVQTEQLSRDFHRAWHETARAWTRTMGPIRDALIEIGRVAQEARAANYALTPPTDDDTEDTMTTPALPLEAWRVEPNDDVTLTSKTGVIGGRVVRIQTSATKGTGLYLYGRGLPYWVGALGATWTLTEHKPAIPTVLRVGARYHVMTSDDRHFQAHWSPIDGTRANHPWLHPDGETRYRQDLIVRARLADTEGEDR